MLLQDVTLHLPRA